MHFIGKYALSVMNVDFWSSSLNIWYLEMIHDLVYVSRVGTKMAREKHVERSKMYISGTV